MEPQPLTSLTVNPSKLATAVRARFLYLYNACGGEDAEQHSEWIPGITRAVEECAELDEDPEALAAFSYLTGVADTMGMGILGMLTAVLGSSW